MRLLRGCALGDTILLLGAAVYFSRKLGRIRVLTSPDYVKSVSDLLLNHPEIQAFSYENESNLPKDGTITLFDSAGNSLLRELNDSPVVWYKKMGIPYKERWDSSPVPDATASIYPCRKEPVFVHDDAVRGFIVPVGGYRPPVTQSIIDHVPALKGAKEIHCMESSIFNLVESMDPLNAELFYYPSVKSPYPFTPRRYNWQLMP